MKVYLTKQNRKTTDFALFEAEDKFVKFSGGKVGKSGITNWTLNAGSPTKAIEEINKQSEELINKGYKISEIPRDLVTRDVTFDKAKWHVNDDFPEELDQYQSYVHTGLFVCWLIENNQYEEEFVKEHEKEVDFILHRLINPSEFYEEYLDGIFDADGLTQTAIKFVSEYFDFEKGNYINDYLSVLDPTDSLPSIFHIDDTWENYDKLKPVIDLRFNEWKNINK